MFLPVVKNVPVPKVMKGIVDFIGTDTSVTSAHQVWYMTTEEATKFGEMFRAFLDDSTTPEEFAAKIKEVALQAADQYIEEHPEDKIGDYLDKVQK